MTLTIEEIISLAKAAGLRIEEAPSDMDDLENEMTIETCPTEGLLNDDGTKSKYRFIAYWDEYPEEGSFGLGKSIQPEILEGGK